MRAHIARMQKSKENTFSAGKLGSYAQHAGGAVTSPLAGSFSLEELNAMLQGESPNEPVDVPASPRTNRRASTATSGLDAMQSAVASELSLLRSMIASTGSPVNTARSILSASETAANTSAQTHNLNNPSTGGGGVYSNAVASTTALPAPTGHRTAPAPTTAASGSAVGVASTASATRPSMSAVDIAMSPTTAQIHALLVGDGASSPHAFSPGSSSAGSGLPTSGSPASSTQAPPTSAAAAFYFAPPPPPPPEAAAAAAAPVTAAAAISSVEQVRGAPLQEAASVSASAATGSSSSPSPSPPAVVPAAATRSHVAGHTAIRNGGSGALITLTQSELNTRISEAVSLAVAEAFEAARLQNEENLRDTAVSGAQDKQSALAESDARSRQAIAALTEKMAGLEAVRQARAAARERDLRTLVNQTEERASARERQMRESIESAHERAREATAASRRLEREATLAREQASDAQAALATSRAEADSLRAIVVDLQKALLTSSPSTAAAVDTPASSSSSAASSQQQVHYQALIETLRQQVQDEATARAAADGRATAAETALLEAQQQIAALKQELGESKASEQRAVDDAVAQAEARKQAQASLDEKEDVIGKLEMQLAAAAATQATTSTATAAPSPNAPSASSPGGPSNSSSSAVRKAAGYLSPPEVEAMRQAHARDIAVLQDRADQERRRAVADALDAHAARSSSAAASAHQQQLSAEALDLARAEARDAVSRDFDRQKNDAVRAALAAAAEDFKAQLTTALSTMRLTMEQEKKKDTDSQVAAARKEYESMVTQWQAQNEEWRRQTLAACEASLDVARQQVAVATDRCARYQQQLEAMTGSAGGRGRGDSISSTGSSVMSMMMGGLGPNVDGSSSGMGVDGRAGFDATDAAEDAVDQQQQHHDGGNGAGPDLAGAGPVIDGDAVNAAAADGHDGPVGGDADHTFVPGSGLSSTSRKHDTSAASAAVPPAAAVSSPLPPSPPVNAHHHNNKHAYGHARGDGLDHRGPGAHIGSPRTEPPPRSPNALDGGHNPSSSSNSDPAHLHHRGASSSTSPRIDVDGDAPVATTPRAHSSSSTFSSSSTPQQQHSGHAVHAASRSPDLGGAPAPTTCAPGAVPPRLYDTIMQLPVSSLRSLLERAGLAHDDCVEKRDLQERLLKAVERGAVGAAGGSNYNGVVQQDDASDGGASPSVAASTGAPATPTAKHCHGHHPHSPPPQQQQQQQTAPNKPSPAELKNWLPAKAADGSTYYYHRITRAVRWDKPDAGVAKRMEERIREEEQELKARQAERLAELQQEEETRQQDAAAKSKRGSEIDARVRVWSRGKGIRSLLLSLDSVLTSRAVPADIAAGVAGRDGATGSVVAVGPDEIKRSYLKALRIVHPDKMATATPEAQLEAQRIFAVLSDAYKKYTSGQERPEVHLPPTSSSSSSSSSAAWQGYHAAAASAGARAHGYSAAAGHAYSHQHHHHRNLSHAGFHASGINTGNVTAAAVARARASMAAHLQHKAGYAAGAPPPGPGTAAAGSSGMTPGQAAFAAATGIGAPPPSSSSSQGDGYAAHPGHAGAGHSAATRFGLHASAAGPAVGSSGVGGGSNPSSRASSAHRPSPASSASTATSGTGAAANTANMPYGFGPSQAAAAAAAAASMASGGGAGGVGYARQQHAPGR